MKTSFRNISALALAIATASSGAYAAQLEEIIVTATKRAQSLQDIPLSVSVTSGETIQRAAIVDIIDLQTSVPSLRVNQLQSSAQTNFTIRGYGNGANNPGTPFLESLSARSLPHQSSMAMQDPFPLLLVPLCDSEVWAGF